VLERFVKIASYTTLLVASFWVGGVAQATTTTAIPSISMVQSSSTNPNVYTFTYDTSEMYEISTSWIGEFRTLGKTRNTGQCYPRGGGSGGIIGATSTQLQINLDVSHSGITTAGAEPCDVTGYYYVVYWNPIDSTDYYYAQYYFNAEQNRVGPSVFYNDLSATSSYQTRIQNVATEASYTTPTTTSFSAGQMNQGFFNDIDRFAQQTISCSDVTFPISSVDVGVHQTWGGTPPQPTLFTVTIDGRTATGTWTGNGIGHYDTVTFSPPVTPSCGGSTFTVYLEGQAGGGGGSTRFSSGPDTYAGGSCTGCQASDVPMRFNGTVNVATLYDVEVTAEYLLETSEIVSTISAKNPTLVQFQLAKRPDGSLFGQAESIDNTVNGTGTVSTTFTALEDGTYDILVKFSNAGCAIGLSSCPFPLAYIYSSFTLESGEITNVGEIEVYDNVIVAPTISQYEDCGLSNLSGCLNNSLRFLFIPSSESLNDLIATKDQLDTRIPFVYVSDIRTVAEEVFNSDQTETLDVTLDLGFGTVPLINESMIANAPQASTVRLILSSMLWIVFAFGAYRMALGVHNKNLETT